jgi:hypothetical protein
MEPQHKNYTFIDRKQGSLASSRGKPQEEKISITIIFPDKTSHTLYSYKYTKSIYPKEQSRGRFF